MINGARSEHPTIGAFQSVSMRARRRARIVVSRCARSHCSSLMHVRRVSRVRLCHIGIDENPTPRARTMRQRIAGGTSLARRTRAQRSRTEVHDRRTHARVKMLDNEIAFDIPCVVPEHVPPRCGALADEHGQCAPSGDSTANLWMTSYERSRSRAPRLSGLCKRGTDQ
jgi:hypothetical protein